MSAHCYSVRVQKRDTFKIVGLIPVADQFSTYRALESVEEMSKNQRILDLNPTGVDNGNIMEVLEVSWAAIYRVLKCG